MRFLDDTEADDPIISGVNLIDVFLVIVAILMVAIVRNPLNPFAKADVVVVENPGRGDMRITVRQAEQLTRYETSGAIGEGRGVRAGITYRLPDGRMIYVPEDAGPAERARPGAAR